MASVTQTIPPKPPWIEMRRTISLGNIVTMLAWIIFGIVAFTRLEDQQNAIVKEFEIERTQTQSLADILSVVQQNSASQTAMIEALRERLTRDESELDGRRR